MNKPANQRSPLFMPLYSDCLMCEYGFYISAGEKFALPDNNGSLYCCRCNHRVSHSACADSLGAYYRFDDWLKDYIDKEDNDLLEDCRVLAMLRDAFLAGRNAEYNYNKGKLLRGF